MSNKLTEVLSERNEQIKKLKAQLRYSRKLSKIEVPEGLYDKCPKCEKQLLKDDIIDNDFTCINCGEHFRIRAHERIAMTVDEDSFTEKGLGYKSLNPLDTDQYEEKIEISKTRTDIDEAYVYGYARIEGSHCIIGVMDSYFMLGSMGSVVGEKVTKSIELAIEKKLPLIIFTASGGARMQEGIFSLMQMAKTSQELAKLDEEGLLYISVVTHPTTGGVTASFAMLGDLILAEPGALIGFAGPRVIEQTIGEKLPNDFQRSEFLKKKGFIDKVVNRKDMRKTLSTILKLHKM